MAGDDPERDRLTGRVSRFARVGAGLGVAGAGYGANLLFGGDAAGERNARLVKEALGRLKGPLMKAAQMFATVPDLLPPEFAKELQELQTNAPPMGWSFVRRRMAAELGPDWETKFGGFEREAAAAASLGQVHRATGLDGRALAVKLQYPDMQSAVESDLGQLRFVFGLFKRLDGTIDPSEIAEEVADRLREELDYGREARHMALYRAFFDRHDDIAVPEPVFSLSTRRLLTMEWLEGRGLLSFKAAPQATRNRIARLLFEAWWSPMTHLGVIHGDPHLGNYTFAGEADRLNLLDFGCVRIFPPAFVGGVVDLYRALIAGDRDAQAAAYEGWGFKGLTNDLIDVLNVWARFIYGPLLDDRVRTVADGVSPGEYGRREAFLVKQALKEKGPVTIPREFVFMDRAAIGLGAAFLHLGAELNWRALFERSLEGFETQALARRQAATLQVVGLA
ncbi:AarF/UbiB family protein [Caulobacter sp. 17J65-9]|uniref:AarF/UbiB family protein n=1 Tax=Caulobacter sp. 17J65-9 TaxID=2709382 RepID=UPI0013C9AC8A|nr:AarF/ABC1/UbiB kinase family protein [Caulobacter sp. 17J65-9]